MKKIMFILVTIGSVFSCNNDDDNNLDVELIGNWKLIEILADPGTGGVTFSSVESDKIITFESGGIITSNGNLCDLTINSDNQTSGTYSSSESTINTTDCSNIPDYNITFEQNGKTLIINYPCFEPCKAKYIKE